jgi:photosystem II stability/assembly factor-like uncharacterized protein
MNVVSWLEISEESKSVWIGAVLLGAFVAVLGWYFAASYLVHRQLPSLREKALTAHDDLLGIAGSGNGNEVAVGKFGVILVSADKGKTWERRASNTAKTLAAVSFADSNHGFAAGSGGALLATNDGGALWRAQRSGTQDQLLAVHAVDAKTAFVVGAFGTLLSTSDGGESWKRHEFKWDQLIGKIINEFGYVEPNLNSVHFSSRRRGWIVGEFGLILNTDDGGNTWSAQRYGNDLPQLYSVKFVDDERGWGIGQAGSLIHTADGGKRWSPIEIAQKRDLYSISVDGKLAIIVGDGVAFGSHDAGLTWKEILSGSGDQWLSDVRIRNREAIGVGRGGSIQFFDLEKLASVPKETR